MKVERIIRKLQEGKTVSEIARDEKINRYSVALVKQALLLLEKEKQTEQQKEQIDEINKMRDEVGKLRDENKKLKSKISELLEQNKKLSNRLNENRSFLKCITEHQYEFLSVLFGYAIIFVIIVAIVEKLKGG